MGPIIRVLASFGPARMKRSFVVGDMLRISEFEREVELEAELELDSRDVNEVLTRT